MTRGKYVPTRLQWLEGQIDASERLVANGFLGYFDPAEEEPWWVDFDTKTGIAYGYQGHSGTLRDDELPEKP